MVAEPASEVAGGAGVATPLGRTSELENWAWEEVG